MLLFLIFFCDITVQRPRFFYLFICLFVFPQVTRRWKYFCTIMRDKVKTLGQELEALGLHRYVDAQVLVPYASFYTNHPSFMTKIKKKKPNPLWEDSVSQPSICNVLSTLPFLAMVPRSWNLSWQQDENKTAKNCVAREWLLTFFCTKEEYTGRAR